MPTWLLVPIGVLVGLALVAASVCRLFSPSGAQGGLGFRHRRTNPIAERFG